MPSAELEDEDQSLSISPFLHILLEKGTIGLCVDLRSKHLTDVSRQIVEPKQIVTDLSMLY
jgi:hypothetical protein